MSIIKAKNDQGFNIGGRATAFVPVSNYHKNIAGLDQVGASGINLNKPYKKIVNLTSSGVYDLDGSHNQGNGTIIPDGTYTWFAQGNFNGGTVLLENNLGSGFEPITDGTETSELTADTQKLVQIANKPVRIIYHGVGDVTAGLIIHNHNHA